MAEEQNWGTAREEGIFPLFLKEEGGEQKGEQGQDSGGCREPGGLSAEKGADLGFQATYPGGRSVVPWATSAHSPPLPLAQVTPPGPLGIEVGEGLAVGGRGHPGLHGW